MISWKKHKLKNPSQSYQKHSREGTYWTDSWTEASATEEAWEYCPQHTEDLFYQLLSVKKPEVCQIYSLYSVVFIII